MEKNKNYRLKFVKYLKGEYVQYQIRLICIEDSSINVEFLERFSTLKDLHEVFKKEANSINFPKFPPKKFFGSTDEKFLNQRQTALEHYFGTILGSKEFASLPSIKTWIDGLIKKHNKSSIAEANKTVPNQSEKNEKVAVGKVVRSDSNSEKVTSQTFLKNNESVQRCKEVVDKYSKNFIDLNNDNNPHYEVEDALTKEKNYKNLLKTNSVFDLATSNFFKVAPGDNSHFECLGLEEPKIAVHETKMLAKLSAMSKHIAADVPEEYLVDELVVKINISRR